MKLTEASLRNPAAVAVVTEGEQECFAPDRRELQRTLGRVHGFISDRIVRQHFMGAYPGARTGLAEAAFITTAPAPMVTPLPMVGCRLPLSLPVPPSVTP